MQGAGRGRGRGGKSRLLEQLGVEKNEVIPTLETAPSENYPQRTFYPIPTAKERSDNEKYALSVKKEIIEHFQMSQYYLQQDEKRSTIELFSDRYTPLSNHKGPLKLHCIRSLPKELLATPSTSGERKKKAVRVKVRPKIPTKGKSKDISQTLEELEKREMLEGKETEHTEENERKSDEEEIEEDEEADEEMDEGNDYARNYYDNEDEGVDDENDNLDDGGYF